MKNVCIAVRSVTYAQKAKTVLDKSGIPGRIMRKNKETATGCGWCIAVAEHQAEQAKQQLRSQGVKITGEIYDLP